MDKEESEIPVYQENDYPSHSGSEKHFKKSSPGRPVKDPLKIFSFFSGAGILDLGFEKAGFSIEFVNEHFEPFVDAYKHSRKQLKLDEPALGYHSSSIEDFTQRVPRRNLSQLVQSTFRQGALVGFIGGPPCPDFSNAGKNRGRDGENGRLSEIYVDLIIQQMPHFFIFENVLGLWDRPKHRAFYLELKDKLHAAGYLLDDRIINALEFGVPQNRERLILFGVRKHIAMTLNLTRGDDGTELGISFPWLKFAPYEKDAALGCNWPTEDEFLEDSQLECPAGIIPDLTIEHWFRKNDVCNHPNSEHFFKPKQALERFLNVPEGDTKKKSFKRLHRWRYSPTASYGNNEVHLHPYKARRLSAAEAMAVQSLPKDFQLPPEMPLTHMFKTIGNGVPFLAAEGIALSVRSFMGF